MDIITIPKKFNRKNDDLVIIPRKEYEALLGLKFKKLIDKDTVPTYNLRGKAAVAHDKMVEDSLQEYRDGKTIQADSISDAVRKYAKKNTKS